MGAQASRPLPQHSDVSGLVEQAISSHPVVVFSKSYCPYCVKAKKALSAAGATNIKVFELNQMGAQGSAIQSYLASKTGRSTVPSVFVGGKPIGGGDETAALHRAGNLSPLLAQASAAMTRT